MKIVIQFNILLEIYLDWYGTNMLLMKYQDVIIFLQNKRMHHLFLTKSKKFTCFNL